MILRLLYIEDDVLVARGATRVFERLLVKKLTEIDPRYSMFDDIDVSWLQSAEDALAKWRLDEPEVRPHLVVSDNQVLGALLGSQLLLEIANTSPQTGLVLLAGNATRLELSSALIEKGVALLGKPADPSVLIARIHQVLGPRLL